MAGISTSDNDASTPLLQSDTASTLGPASSNSSIRHSSPSPERRRRLRVAAVTRGISFVSAVIAALCSNSVAVFSLYGHIFQERLHYTQYQVNGVAIAASFALYLPVPFLGYVCDRTGPRPLSLMAAVFFGAGYALAATLYKRAATEPSASSGAGSTNWSYLLMVVAFLLIGTGTSCLYMAAIATCAKNFGKGKHRGLALAVPIAACGLSGMWLSQFGSRVLYERLPDGTKGDVDVFHFFLFLAILLVVVGIIGTFTLRVVNEQDLIDEAVEELERSGLLDGSALFTPGRNSSGYGAIEQPNPLDEEDDAGLLDPSKDLEDDRQFKKNFVLNAETRRFLTDRTMWPFAIGFFFMIGPGEAFLNNLGTVIKTLYSPTLPASGVPTSAATHVFIVCLTSTFVRLIAGGLTDLLAPSPKTQHVQIPSSAPILQRMRFSISRVSFLLFFALLMSLGMAILASGAIQEHGERFWIVSGLIGAGYGAIFSLTPIIITVIWGVENFGTNWGIVAMFPALGATMWGLIYSAIYQAGAEKSPGFPGDDGGEDEGDSFCYGTQCYSRTFWAMAGSIWLACFLVLWAWKGRKGWTQRGIVV